MLAIKVGVSTAYKRGFEAVRKMEHASSSKPKQLDKTLQHRGTDMAKLCCTASVTRLH
eukprot:COSAG03_NODE_1180_length_4634_cov_1.858655_3_plen_58_part_00